MYRDLVKSRSVFCLSRRQAFLIVNWAKQHIPPLYTEIPFNQDTNEATTSLPPLCNAWHCKATKCLCVFQSSHTPKESSVHLISLIYDWQDLANWETLWRSRPSHAVCTSRLLVLLPYRPIDCPLSFTKSAALGKEDKWPRVCPDPSSPPNVAANRSPWNMILGQCWAHLPMKATAENL